MSAYEQLVSASIGGAFPEGATLIAILDDDGLMSVCPVSPQLMDDPSNDAIVTEAFADLLEARRMRKEQK